MATNNFNRKILLIISLGLAIFTILPILAPVFAYLGIEPMADLIYWIYQWFCHQRPWRSYHIFDYQFAMDARMMLMFGSLSIASMFVYIKKIKPINLWGTILFTSVFILPLAIDGSVQAIAEISASVDKIPFYESTNFIRSLTGTLFGIGIGFGVMPYLNSQEREGKVKNYLYPILATFIFSLAFIFLINILGSITSNKYKPSGFFIDSEQRFPGYNYEITEASGHTTIHRILEFNEIERYIERAKYFEKTQLLEEYNKSQNN